MRETGEADGQVEYLRHIHRMKGSGYAPYGDMRKWRRRCWLWALIAMVEGFMLWMLLIVGR